jgi:hypothetical protein
VPSCPVGASFHCVVSDDTLVNTDADGLVYVAKCAANFVAAGGATYSTQHWLGGFQTPSGTLREIASLVSDVDQRAIVQRFLDHTTFQDAIALIAADEQIDVVVLEASHTPALITYVLNGTLISAPGTGRGRWWPVQVHRLSSSGNIEDFEHELCNCESLADSDHHRHNHFPAPVDGVSFNASLSQRFPKLIFSREGRQNIRKLAAGHPLLAALLRRLTLISTYVSAVAPGAQIDIDSLGFKASPESSSRLKSLAAAFEATGDDGVKRAFTLHGRLTPDEWRIYFDGNADQTGRLAIGYMGPKIPD